MITPTLYPDNNDKTTVTVTTTTLQPLEDLDTDVSSDLPSTDIPAQPPNDNNT